MHSPAVASAGYAGGHLAWGNAMHGLMQDWPLRLHRIIDHASVQHGAREIVSRVADGSITRTTYAALRTRSLRIAARLRQDGIGPADRVATLCWNGADHLAVWFATTGVGAVYHTVNPRLFPDQIGWIIRHAQDRVIVTEAMFLPILERMAADLPSLERVIVLPPGPADGGGAFRSCVAFDDWLAETEGAVDWVELDERDAAGLCYTSGTTGDPKGVLYSHRSSTLHAMLVSGTDVIGLGARDTIMPVVPMFHVSAWGIPFAAPMVGAKMVMPGGRLDATSLCELFVTEQVTVSAGVPTVWLAMLDHLRRNGPALPHLRRLVVGGSACPRALIEGFETEFGIEVLHAWGMTETSPVASAAVLKPPLPDQDRETRMRARLRQGFAPFGVEMKIVDDAGTPLPWDGETFGRLMVKGFGVIAGYYGETNEILDAAGFFDTGDIATIDPNGSMHIVDRSKDVIKSGGEWISSIAIENLAVSHPGVAEAAVIGIAHPTWRERPLLVIVGRDGATPSREEMLAFLAPKMARWALPDDVKIVAELPHTATGKISKRLLRAQFADLVSPGPATA